MLNLFISFLKAEDLIENEKKILLAVSGGIDSVAMVDLFSKAGFLFGIAHVNFHLRGKESDRDEQFVKSLAERYKAKLFIKHFDTAGFAREKKISVQVAARDLRYSWFDELLTEPDYDFVATAHHLDDQVETLLINMTRGTGISGLHGIPLRQGKIVRPMMFAWRKDIEAYAAEHHLEYVEDSSNSSVKYARNRIRHKIIPQLEKLNPSFKQSILEMIEKMKDTEAIYRDAVEKKRNSLLVIHGDEISIAIDEFYNMTPLSAWAYELLAPFGFNAGNIRDIIGLKNAMPGKEVLSASHRLIRDRDGLIIVPRSNSDAADCFEITTGDIETGFKGPVILEFKLCDAYPGTLNTSPDEAYMDLDRLEFPLILRKWKKGDYFYPLGMKHRKKLSDFFTDLKFTKPDKENQWLLCSGENIIWVPGYRLDDRVKVETASQKILKILFRKTSKLD